MTSPCAVPAAITPARRVPTTAIMTASRRCHRINVRASVAATTMKEKAASVVTTAAAVAAAFAVPQVADAAAGPGISPSLKNFLLSIGAGGLVLLVIFGAVVGVSNFDPVKRRER